MRRPGFARPHRTSRALVAIARDPAVASYGQLPPVRLLMALRSNEETPSKTPWWLILLRMLLAALVIFALAHPVLNPSENLRGSGPLFLVIDDGWASASDWPLRQQKMSELLNQAEREDRPVHILDSRCGAG